MSFSAFPLQRWYQQADVLLVHNAFLLLLKTLQHLFIPFWNVMPFLAFYPCDASLNKLVRSCKVKHASSHLHLASALHFEMWVFQGKYHWDACWNWKADRCRKHSFVSIFLDAMLRQSHLSSHCWVVQGVSSTVWASTVSFTYHLHCIALLRMDTTSYPAKALTMPCSEFIKGTHFTVHISQTLNKCKPAALNTFYTVKS